jgi:hypothetical protein
MATAGKVFIVGSALPLVNVSESNKERDATMRKEQNQAKRGQFCAGLVTEMRGWPIMSKLPGGQRQFGAVEQCLQGFVGDGVNFLVGHPGPLGQGHQALIPPSRALDNCELERPQDFAAIMTGICFGSFHGLFDSKHGLRQLCIRRQK